jgi:adenylate cyclase class 2
MEEIELKVLEIEKEALEKKLIAIGAVKAGIFLIVEKAFDFPDQRIKAEHNLLRLRRIGNNTELVFKDNLRLGDGFKTQTETEITVSDFATTETLLAKLGLAVYRNREKIRTEYKRGATKFEVDEYPNIPAYLEIEGSRESIIESLGMLGFSLADTTDMTATEVLKKYGVDISLQSFAPDDPRVRTVSA